jgi:hypothetical protein
MTVKKKLEKPNREQQFSGARSRGGLPLSQTSVLGYFSHLSVYLCEQVFPPY